MPGIHLSQVSRKADVVVVAARYDASRRELTRARAYERRGAVWSDALLLDREALLARLQLRRKVYVGAVNPAIPGDFVVHGRVRSWSADGRTVLAAGDSTEGHDDLGIPTF